MENFNCPCEAYRLHLTVTEKIWNPEEQEYVEK